mmetsp:Transcript_78663/g.217498  ORF Transcript_78663/g.217498 Transcript_78663/m.217498 type:complete len:229 (-) Transcript_78663:512-1198(-)
MTSAAWSCDNANRCCWNWFSNAWRCCWAMRASIMASAHCCPVNSAELLAWRMICTTRFRESASSLVCPVSAMMAASAAERSAGASLREAAAVPAASAAAAAAAARAAASCRCCCVSRCAAESSDSLEEEAGGLSPAARGGPGECDAQLAMSLEPPLLGLADMCWKRSTRMRQPATSCSGPASRMRCTLAADSMTTKPRLPGRMRACAPRNGFTLERVSSTLMTRPYME